MDTKNFDNIVKSMMESAQEEVSPRVWAGVQKGLQAAQARHSRIIFFKRAGYAIAAAAAAVALLLATGLLSDNSIQPNISNEAITLVPETPAATTATDSGREGLQTAETPAVKPEVKTAKRTVVKSVSETESAPETIAEELVAETVVPAAKEEKPVAVTEKPAKDYEDPFAIMLQEDLAAAGKSKRGLRLRLGTNIGDNGVHTSAYSAPVRRAQQGSQYRNVIRENGESSYKIPISFGLGLDIPVSGKFSIGTGLSYTSLSRTFPGRYLKYDDATGNSELLYGDARHTVKYIGIPVNVFYHFTSAGNFAFYTYGGGEIERSILNKYSIALNTGKITHKANNTGFQLSVQLGVGAEYKFNKYLGIYIDPSLKYYFDGNQPKSIRTQHPWMLNVEAGLRFNLK